MVYELSTGNNDVTALAWDARRSHLYAATRCAHLDKNGEARFYRAAEVDGEFAWREDKEDAYSRDVVVWPSDTVNAEGHGESAATAAKVTPSAANLVTSHKHCRHSLDIF